MEAGYSFKSLEEPTNYFGCHIHVAFVAILAPVFSLLGFLFLEWLSAFLIVLGTMAISATIFVIGAWLGKDDPFWVEAGQQHLLEEEKYLDV